MNQGNAPPRAPPAAPAPEPPARVERPRWARSFRRWAVVASCHGALVAAAATWLVPWKTPWANALLVGYGLLQLVAAVGLWQLRRWGWRLAIGTAVAGLVLGALIVAGLVASFVYLRTAYGVYGYGASLASLLFALVASQLLGLVPGWQLWALGRRAMRRELAASGRW